VQHVGVVGWIAHVSSSDCYITVRPISVLLLNLGYDEMATFVSIGHRLVKVRLGREAESFYFFGTFVVADWRNLIV